MKKLVTCLMTVVLALSAVACGSSDAVQMGEGKIVVEGTHKEIKRVSVHDPSIVKDKETGTYYVFGSHLATAKSTDLVNWTQVLRDYQNTSNNPIYGNLAENFAESFEWAGHLDGDCSKGFAVWAPDVFWNEYYEWEDGSKGAYLLYYSASSTWRRSCIGMAASKNIEGPYEYVDTLIYSGITADGTTDGRSKRNTKWDNDYLNFNELLALGSANGGIDEINQKWFKSGGSEYNTDYAPNAIDPTIVTGRDGDLYMVYGSWSGGLFILEVDKATGLVKYPGVDGVDEASGNYIDRYYGLHLAGGNHQSGEGAYIIYDKETDYYYMYETYGGLTREGGYNMRLFRSKDIYGPYVDAAGRNSADNGVNNYVYGIKLLTNYQFTDQRGYCSAGHNSAMIDEDGNRYLVFHQRFDEGTEYHEVRVRQQFLNEDDWPVLAVYENRNEVIGHYSDSEVLGGYELIMHGVSNATKLTKTLSIELTKDGQVVGDLEGTWVKTKSERGYDYITVTTEKAIYKGYFFEQTNDNGVKVMTFTAIGNNNESITATKGSN